MRLGGAAAAITLVMAALAAPGAVPASAATGCTPQHGVTVVADFHDLDHRDVRVCDAEGGGRSAAQLFERSGLPLTDVQRQPGFVCRVAGLPADDPCVNTPPAGAYWSLWWSDGSSGNWVYSTTSATSLEVPDGGFVALVWDDQAADLSPATTPVAGRSGASPAPDADAPAGADAGGEGGDGGGVPAWVAPGAIGLLLVAAGGTAVVRRRKHP